MPITQARMLRLLAALADHRDAYEELYVDLHKALADPSTLPGAIDRAKDRLHILSERHLANYAQEQGHFALRASSNERQALRKAIQRKENYTLPNKLGSAQKRAERAPRPDIHAEVAAFLRDPDAYAEAETAILRKTGNEPMPIPSVSDIFAQDKPD